MKIRKSFGYLVNYTVRNMRRYATNTLKANAIDLTVDQWGVLEILSEYENGTSLTNLSGIMLKDLPTLTNIVDLLCKKGLTERKVNAEDRRKFDILLTEKGQKITRKAKHLIQEIREHLSSKIDEEELEIFLTVLGKINAVIDD